ncbi:hypothetical protein AN221_21280 [Streptomyces nanshensis]|uniref:Uncharacterized protein n=1 Tax=Streptomyces nanshensis TaxID=518642 RepID=A0A1E7LQY3_9ACTN|nr:hypothetical protein AN221_21280 [Streptomyces nanshensis]
MSPAAARASRISFSCEGPCGAVSPLLAPSWLTADPRTTARTRWPLRRASDSRSTRSVPAPSAHAVPSAPSAYDLARPSGASPRWRLNSVKENDVAISITPLTTASEHSSRCRDCPARCRATREEEQAVLTVTAGSAGAVRSRPAAVGQRPAPRDRSRAQPPAPVPYGTA